MPDFFSAKTNSLKSSLDLNCAQFVILSGTPRRMTVARAPDLCLLAGGRLDTAFGQRGGILVFILDNFSTGRVGLSFIKAVNRLFLGREILAFGNRILIVRNNL